MVWQCFVRWSEKADAREIECHCQVGVANDGDCTALFLGFLQLLLDVHPGLRNDGCKFVGQAQGRQNRGQERFKGEVGLE